MEGRLSTTYAGFDADGGASVIADKELQQKLHPDTPATLLLHGGTDGTIQADAKYALEKAGIRLKIAKGIPQESVGGLIYDSSYIGSENGVIIDASPIVPRSIEIVVFDGLKTPPGSDGQKLEDQVTAFHDHHPNNNGKEKKIFPNLRVVEYGGQEKLGAIATYETEQYVAHRITPSREIATLLMYGILSNTEGLLGTTSTKRDEKAIEFLKPFAGIEDHMQAYFSMLEHISSQITKETVGAVVRSDVKDEAVPELGKLAISQIQGINLKRLVMEEEIFKEIEKTLTQIREERRVDIAILSCVEARRNKQDLGCNYITTTEGGEQIFTRLGAIKQNQFFILAPGMLRKEWIPRMHKDFALE